MKPITIRIAGEDEPMSGGFVVEQDGRYADGLGWDEMIGHFIALTLREPSVQQRLKAHGPGLYNTGTREEHETRRQDQLERIAPVMAKIIADGGAAVEPNK